MTSLLVIPINIITDLAYIATKWTVNQCLNGTKYLIWGYPKSPEMIKLEELENKLENLDHFQSHNLKYYWEIKDKHEIDTWLVIRQQAVIFVTQEKAEALRTIGESMLQTVGETKNNRYLLIQVGNEKYATEL